MIPRFAVLSVLLLLSLSPAASGQTPEATPAAAEPEEAQPAANEMEEADAASEPAGSTDPQTDVSAPTRADKVESDAIYIIPVRDQIGPPTLFAIRSGLKEAIEGEFDTVVLDMQTPGGRLDTTLEIMEVLDRFPGKTVTYVNDEATSAGAIIASVTNQIYFAPRGTMGSAEPVTGTGEDINESMKRKIMSYLNAKMDAYTYDYPYRSEVIRAMMDPSFEFKIGDEMISPEGEILNLNAQAAHEEYGDPPQPLLGSGIVGSMEALVERLANGAPERVERFEPTWSLDLAHLIVSLAPLLIAVATISVYIELQTPGFGVFGITGVICFLLAMFGHHVAGLSGQEPMLLFVLGVLLLGLEIVIAPGSLIFAIPGLIVMLGSILWSMVDIWPEGTEGFDWEWNMLERPLQNTFGGILLGIFLILVLARFLPKSLIWNRLVLREAVEGTSQPTPSPAVGGAAAAARPPATGDEGLARTALVPGGEIEIDGRRYEAQLSYGSAPRGTRVRVVKKSDFGYIVEEVRS